MNNIDDIKHAFYINLDTRPDRKQHIENQLSIIKLKAERFKAVKLTNGALGCSMSHLKILEMAKQNNYDHVLILEDDIQFLQPEIFIKQMNLFLEKHKDFDVVLIAGNNMPPFNQIDETCVKVTSCQTTTGYLVQNHYFYTLICNIKEGILKLMKEPNQHKIYALDKYWFHLQRIHRWYLIIPLTVTQREDYSDIEKRATNYSRAMLDLDKQAFIKAQMSSLNKTRNINSFQLY